MFLLTFSVGVFCWKVQRRSALRRLASLVVIVSSMSLVICLYFFVTWYCFLLSLQRFLFISAIACKSELFKDRWIEGYLRVVVLSP